MRPFICLDIPEFHEDREKSLLFCRTVVNTKYDMTKFSNKRWMARGKKKKEEKKVSSCPDSNRGHGKILIRSIKIPDANLYTTRAGYLPMSAIVFYTRYYFHSATRRCRTTIYPPCCHSKSQHLVSAKLPYFLPIYNSDSFASRRHISNLGPAWKKL